MAVDIVIIGGDIKVGSALYKGLDYVAQFNGTSVEARSTRTHQIICRGLYSDYTIGGVSYDSAPAWVAAFNYFVTHVDMKTLAVTSETTFTDFSSISIIDAGTDGFVVKGSASGSAEIQIPSGGIYNFGRMDQRVIKSLTVKAVSGKTLSVSVSIIY